MTFRRARRPDDGRFTPRDGKLWRRLIKHARYAVRAPLADTTQLYKAAETCGRCVPPAGQAHRGSPFHRLATLARGFGRLSDPERQAIADELAMLAETCAQALDAPPPGAHRADIFG